MREVTLEAGGLLRGSSAPALQAFLERQPGIHHAAANTASQTVTVGYDETRISEAEIRRLIEECGYHCQGEVLPRHLCAPGPGRAVDHRPPELESEHPGHAVRVAAAPAAGETAQMAHAMGHGAGMSMEEMVRDMRNRFWLTFLLAIPVFLYSPMATEILGLRLPAPLGIRNRVVA